MLTVLGLLTASCLTPPAHAVQVPEFVPGQAVYLVPESFRFATRETLAAVSHTTHPVYVVVYEEVIDGHIEAGHSSETEDAIEQVWSTWRTESGEAASSGEGGFDGREGSLVLLAMDDREVRAMAGSRWDAEQGLHTEALGSLVDASFLPLARAGDYDGALASLVKGLDARIEEGLAAQARAREAEARLTADAAEEAQRQAVEEKRQAERMAAMVALIPVGVGAFAFALALLAVLLLRLRALRARRRFTEAFAELEAALDAADNAFADFRVDVEIRDRLVDLRLKGPTTTALYAQVTGDLDAIQAGLAGLRRHLSDCRAGVDAGFFAVKPWDAAIARLQTRLTVEPANTEGRLFPAADTALEVEPQAFMDGLEDRFGAAHAGWKRLLDAVEASLHRAEQDLARARLDAAASALAEAGLPEVWLTGHPLMPAAAAAWAALDELRRADPVAYLEALERDLEADEEIFARANEVAASLEAGRARRAAAEEPSLAGLDTVTAPEDGDPAAAKAEADLALAALELRAKAQPQADLEALRGALAKVHATCDAWLELKKHVLDAVVRAPARVAEAEAAFELLEEAYVAGRARAKDLAAAHDADSLAAAWREVGEAREDLEQAREATLQARARLGERRHTAALALAGRALAERGEAVQDLAELTAALQDLEKARTEAEAMQRSLAERRRTLARQVAQYGTFGGERRFAEGDALREAMAAEWAAGAPADWQERRERLQAVLRAWTAGVAAARKAWHAEQARLEQKRLADEIWLAEVQRTEEFHEGMSSVFSSGRHHGTSSSYSSFSCGGGHRSSSSRHSGGRSFGGGHRSGGRSFGGGGRSRGRSGGRKF